MPKLSTTAAAVVWLELDGGRTHPNPVGSGRDLSDQHGRRRACDGDEVMLGDPETSVAPLFGVLGQLDGVAQGRRRRHFRR